MFSTLEDVQYIGGCSVHEGEGCSVSWRYHKYIEDIMSTLGGGGGGEGDSNQPKRHSNGQISVFNIN